MFPSGALTPDGEQQAWPVGLIRRPPRRMNTQMGQVGCGLTTRLEGSEHLRVLNSPWTNVRVGCDRLAPLNTPEVASADAELVIGGWAVRAQRLLRREQSSTASGNPYYRHGLPLDWQTPPQLWAVDAARERLIRTTNFKVSGGIIASRRKSGKVSVGSGLMT